MPTISTSTNNFQIQLRKETAKAGKFIYVGLPTSKNTVRVLTRHNKWMLVDLNGKPLINEVDNLLPFSEGLARVDEKKHFTGNDKYFIYERYFIDEYGNRILSPSLSAGRTSYFSEGLAVVKNKENKLGYVDKTGKLVIPCIFKQATEFSDSVAWVKDFGSPAVASLFSLIDKEGKETTSKLFSVVNNFVDGVAAVQIPDLYFGGKLYIENFHSNYVIINKKGKKVSNQKFLFVREFVDNVAVACIQNGTYIFINKIGEQISKNTYHILDSFYEGICRVWLPGDKVYYLDKEENQISSIYDTASNFSEGLGCVREKEKFFFIDRSGKKAFSYVFDEAQPFDEGVARVEKDQQIFYIDHDGEKAF